VQVDCLWGLYDLTYGRVASCSPRNESSCARWVEDSFVTKTEAAQLKGIMSNAMINLFHQGGQTSFAPDAKASHARLGPGGLSLFSAVQGRIRATIMEKFGLPQLYDAGTLFTRLEGEPRHDEWDMEPGHK